jgi:hypothetical protein
MAKISEFQSHNGEAEVKRFERAATFPKWISGGRIAHQESQQSTGFAFVPCARQKFHSLFTGCGSRYNWRTDARASRHLF